MARIVNRIEIIRPVEAVFDFITTPRYWPRWHPSTIAVVGQIDAPLGHGGQVTEEIKVMGRHDRTRWTVHACEHPHLWAILGQRQGGGSARLTYRCAASGSGTLLEGELVYRMPGVMPNVLDRMVIRHVIAAESNRAVARLKALLEAES